MLKNVHHVHPCMHHVTDLGFVSNLCTAASRLPGKDNFASYSAVYTDKVTLRCPNEANLTQPSWGRIVHGRKLGIAQCYDNAFNCTISGGVVNEDGIQLLGNDDSGLYFCRDARSYDETYYLNLTVFCKSGYNKNFINCF